jgi:mRNA-degrading endonuclease toxin of MazEF toxin-antitoxin module
LLTRQKWRRLPDTGDARALTGSITPKNPGSITAKSDTTPVRKSKEPLHVTIPARDELRQDCQVMPEQPRTLDRRRLTEGPLARLRPAEREAVEKSLLAVMGMYP